MDIRPVIDQLTAKAVLGADRARLHLDEIVNDSLQVIAAQLDELPPEEQILSLAGALWLYGRAGLEIPCDPLQDISLAEPEKEQSPAPECLIEYFFLMMTDKQWAIFPEWVYWMYQKKYHVPFHMVTDLLHLPYPDDFDNTLLAYVLPRQRTNWLLDNGYIKPNYRLDRLNDTPDFQRAKQEKLIPLINEKSDRRLIDDKRLIKRLEGIYMPYTLELSREIYRRLRADFNEESDINAEQVILLSHITTLVVPTAMDSFVEVLLMASGQLAGDLLFKVSQANDYRRLLHSCIGV